MSSYIYEEQLNSAFWNGPYVFFVVFHATFCWLLLASEAESDKTFIVTNICGWKTMKNTHDPFQNVELIVVRRSD